MNGALEVIILAVNTKHLYNIYTELDQRLRRWAGVVWMLYKYFVFAGKDLYHPKTSLWRELNNASDIRLLSAQISVDSNYYWRKTTVKKYVICVTWMSHHSQLCHKYIWSQSERLNDCGYIISVDILFYQRNLKNVMKAKNLVYISSLK